jgi:DMSO/TMAO reductase YedYZ molybdopterin-dependent catalytic subunit
MPRWLTNLLLLLLLLMLTISGLLGWMLPEWPALALYELHRALGIGLLLVVLLWKQRIARDSLARRLGRRPRDGSVLAGLLVGVALLGSVGLGLAWSLNLVSLNSLWGYSPLNLHVFLGLGVLPLLWLHLRRRPEQQPRLAALASRRGALRMVGWSMATILGWQLLERAAEGRADEGSRRPSGSKHAGSFSGNDFPVTIWLFDSVPLLDPASWRLQLAGRLSQPGPISYQELLELPSREQTAVLDCTGGWWSEQRWRGVPLTDLLAGRGLDPDAQEVLISSVTGHHWRFPLADLRQALLGTHVGDELLSPEHGFPVRLVAPGRRGFQWVKWVGRIEVV